MTYGGTPISSCGRTLSLSSFSHSLSPSLPLPILYQCKYLYLFPGRPYLISNDGLVVISSSCPLPCSSCLSVSYSSLPYSLSNFPYGVPQTVLGPGSNPLSFTSSKTSAQSILVTAEPFEQNSTNGTSLSSFPLFLDIFIHLPPDGASPRHSNT